MSGIASLAALLIACGGQSPTAPEPVLGKPFEIKAGATLTLAGEGLRVEFKDVAEDSRCPVDVTCVWEGDATVQFELSLSSAKPLTVDLHTSGRFARETKYEGFLVKLLELRPQPRSSSPVPAKDYAAKLEVRRP